MIACICAGLVWGCVNQRDHRCVPLPELPSISSPRLARVGPIELDLGDTDGWDVYIGYGHAKLDSGHYKGRQIHVEVDTFRMPGYSDRAAMDTIRVDWERRMATITNLTYSKSEMYCGEDGDRISLIEYGIDSDRQKEYQQVIEAHRFLDGLGIQISSGSTIPRQIGAVPLDMRQRILTWMSAIRSIEK